MAGIDQGLPTADGSPFSKLVVFDDDGDVRADLSLQAVRKN